VVFDVPKGDPACERGDLERTDGDVRVVVPPCDQSDEEGKDGSDESIPVEQESAGDDDDHEELDEEQPVDRVRVRHGGGFSRR
jgi:hypothetical protein